MIRNLAQRNSVVASADVLAVFAELEAKDAQKDIRIAEVEKRLKQREEEAESRIAALKNKLTKPVQLPGKTSDLDSWDGGWDACLEECAEAIRAAGFTVEGDE